MEAPSPTEDFGLLKLVLPRFLKVARSFNQDDLQSSTARQKVNLDSLLPAEPFHATVYAYLKSLDDKVKTWSDVEYLSSERAQETVQNLLHTLEDIVKGLASPGHEAFPSLEWIRSNRTLPSVFLECPSYELRERLEEHLAQCVQEFGADGVSFSITTEAQTQSEWEPAKDFFDNLRSYEAQLQEHLRCECTESHLSTFSFATPCKSPSGRTSYRLNFRRCQSAQNWESATIHVQDNHSKSKVRFSDDQKDESKSTEADSHRTDGKNRHSASFCQLLKGQPDITSKLGARGVFEKFSTGLKSDLWNRSTDRMTSLRSQMQNQIEHQTEHFLKSEADKVVLSLLLGYAFMNLNATSWWPTDWIEPEVWFIDSPATDKSTFKQPFLAHEPIGPKVSVEKYINASNPSLPAFGKLLLEIWTGMQLSWGDIETARLQCENTIAGKAIFNVADNFLNSKSQEVFKGEGRLPETSEMRTEFLNRVIKIYQYILYLNDTSLEKIFLRPQQLDSDLEKPKSSQKLPAPRIHPMKASRALRNQYLMTLEQGSAQPAHDWMTRVRDNALDLLFCNRDPAAPAVKIAILDTGSNFSKRDIVSRFGDRVNEYWSWCKISGSSKGEPIRYQYRSVPEEDRDQEGHGTHLAALLLTIAPHCELYIAKVFGSRSAMHSKGPSELMERRIANAITHAANDWKVDIVSMSFGFQKEVPLVGAAIDSATNATRPVLFLAAASNQGGNDGVAWPASHDRVICVHATDADGNKFAKNPTPTGSPTEFATIGCEVQAYVGDGKTSTRTGTSVATPIAAAIAANTIDIVRNRKAAYLASHTGSTIDMQKRKLDFEQKMKHLSSYRGMSGVFDLMAGACRRDEYRYVRPWEVLKKHDDKHESYIIDRIFEASDRYKI